MSGSRAFLPLVLFFLAMTFSCSDGGKVIPRKKMVSIYADMFVADQWLNQNYKAERVADTSFVYEAIFEKYGYDSEDYRASVDYYIQDPDRFARILRQTVLELEDRMDEQRAELRKLRASSGGGREVTYTFDFDRIWIFENGYPRVTVRDSLEYFRSKNEYFILNHIDLEGAYKLVWIARALLALYKRGYPLQLAVEIFVIRLYSGLVFPMSGDTVFCDTVHLLGSYLHFKGYAVPAYDRCVYRLVHIRLRR